MIVLKIEITSLSFLQNFDFKENLLKYL